MGIGISEDWYNFTPLSPMRYLVFGGDNYYPCGGAEDILGIHRNYSDAQKTAEMHKGLDWIHIFDINKNKIIRV